MSSRHFSRGKSANVARQIHSLLSCRHFNSFFFTLHYCEECLWDERLATLLRKALGCERRNVHRLRSFVSSTLIKDFISGSRWFLQPWIVISANPNLCPYCAELRDFLPVSRTHVHVDARGSVCWCVVTHRSVVTRVVIQVLHILEWITSTVIYLGRWFLRINWNCYPGFVFMWLPLSMITDTDTYHLLCFLQQFMSRARSVV